MLNAVLNFGQAVYNHDHLDVLMQDLIAFISKYEWNVYKDSPQCNWTTSVTVKDISYHLDVEIWKYKHYEGMDKEILNKKEPCPKFNAYYIYIKFQMDSEGEERSPLYDKWQELFKRKVSHRLQYNEDFQGAKELFWDIEKFFMNPEAFMEDDEEECEKEEDFTESEDDSDEESP
jgi:hypothetical protein